MTNSDSDFPGPRILLGPGPSNVDERVRLAMARRLVGHLDPAFLEIMDETQALLRDVFGTDNRMTIPISGTGSAGMEASIVNVVEPGDRVVVGIAGVFGERLAEQARRNGAEVVRVEAPWGEAVPAGAIADAVEAGPTKAVAVVHAETSTGVLQPLDGIVEAAHERDALVIVDAVTSLGGHPVEVDRLGIDVCYSGTQKCLSCPPGLAPVTFADRALEVIDRRSSPVRSWYLDVTLLQSYWGSDRSYHHTAPISMVLALREALRIVDEEGMEARSRRHRLNHLALVAGVEAMGLEMEVDEPERRLWPLNAVRIPDGVEDGRVRRELLLRHDIEIGGGLGPMAGRVWRIGLMGSSSSRNNVLLLLDALTDALRRQGRDLSHGAGVDAALDVYAASG